ncbi:dihydrolipoamide acetyltransferase family protein [Candidatus Viridilinea mediisalina]|uniref:Dihydrolipoamide acetyltransferase component of pyruvate dehydrogenase complex n=1 Tax=Candidatus Viridilinea mediisalina TaxID=2024553 RepID=A0A2A6RE62_9CHLR|nr:dihydrolipoamide acetyltransferase family protein [Candidatus Viridilinea mediisalina]PDW00534.1 dihydrolipoyllysine succinyltransferase [Candidatus Viridilinea mediisalina]
MGEITMPRLSDTMAEGTVGRWLKQPGDQIQVGEIIAEIETDKATMELEAFERGTLQQIIIGEGQTVPIGEVIALMGDGPVVAAAPPRAPEAPAPAAAPAAPPDPAPAPQAKEENGRILASPLARRIANDLGLDLSQIEGSGPGGRIIKANVETFAAKQHSESDAPASPAVSAPPAAPAEANITPLSRMRKAIARTMNESKPGAPHIYVTIEVAMDALLKLREQIKAEGTQLSVNDFVVKAAAQALTKVPALNTSLVSTADGQLAIAQHPAINVSVAIALDDGLIAPAIRDTDKKSLGTISTEIRDLAERARAGRLKQHELEGATFQVTNLGMFGVVEFGSIITLPQAASLAVGAVRSLPVVRDNQVVIGQTMNLTLSADHRIVDGAVAARYLKELRALLEHPLAILI